MVMQIRRTPTADNPPTGLAEGQFAVEMATEPTRVWVGVPTTIDPAGRIPITGLVSTIDGTAPANPRAGTLWWDEAGAQLYVWTGAEWVVAVNPPLPDVSQFLSLSGGTMTGPITLADNANGALEPVTLQQLNALIAPLAQQVSINFIDNGGFNINQRNTWGPNIGTVNGQFAFDRWKAGAGNATTTSLASNVPQIITISSGSIIQVVDGTNLVTGPYTLSWTGTAQGRMGANPYAASPVSLTATAGSDLQVEFNAGTLGQVMLTIGNEVPTWTPLRYQTELVNCQRYFQARGYAWGGFAGATAINIVYSIWLPVRMRAPPGVVNNETASAGLAGRSVTATPDGVTWNSLAANAFSWTGNLALSADL